MNMLGVKTITSPQSFAPFYLCQCEMHFTVDVNSKAVDGAKCTVLYVHIFALT